MNGRIGNPQNSKVLGTNPLAVGDNPRAQGTNPRALRTNPRAKREDMLRKALDNLALAYRRATGLEGAFDPAIRHAELVLDLTRPAQEPTQ